MATADQLKALIRSHADGDDDRFYSVAMQLAAGEAHVGHARVAGELSKLIDDARTRPSQRTAPARPRALVQPRGDLGELLLATYPTQRLHHLVISAPIRAKLERVVTETKHGDELRHHGLAPIRKLLLSGHPGTGKTMTASALAGQLGLPLFSVRLDGLITRFLGETASKLRLIFDAMVQTRGVYFFDEFDALGGERQMGQDVGEIRRVLNSFLQFIEQDESTSLIIAATNHVKLLDKALFRRFDLAIDYVLPDAAQAEDVLRQRLGDLDATAVDWKQVMASLHGLSHAELARAADYAAKDAVLAKSRLVKTENLVAALKERLALLR